MERFQGHINHCFLDRKEDVRRFAIDKEEPIPFLQMLQSEEEDSMKEPNILALLSLQTLKEPWELESYLYSPETNHFYQNPCSDTNQANTNTTIPSSSSRRKRKMSQLQPQEKRKRRKTKPSKNIEEIESQRINHIAVERNRRRTMNEHINSLRSLLPPTYIQRGDQASIVGGAINYVKVLEQTIQSLESQKNNIHPLSRISSNNLCATHETQISIPKVEATIIQDHVNLKVQCLKQQGQLLQGIISLEKLRLTVLHLNITSSSNSYVSYSFNLKIEDDCDLGSSDEITAAVRRIFDIPTS